MLKGIDETYFDFGRAFDIVLNTTLIKANKPQLVLT